MQDSLQYGVHEGTTSGFADGVGQRCSIVAFAHLSVCSVTWFFQELPGVYDDRSFHLCLHSSRDQEPSGFLDSPFKFWTALLLSLYHISKYAFLWFISIAHSLVAGAMSKRYNIPPHDSTSDQLKFHFLWGMHSWGPWIFRLHETLWLILKRMVVIVVFWLKWCFCVAMRKV